MSNPDDVLRLYYTVLSNDIRSHSVKDNEIKAAINNMSQVYKPNPQSLSSNTRRLADYNTVAHRCAYLHKYAPFHTAMVRDLLRRILYQNQTMFWTFQEFSASKFKICSLGGGPGSDIVGVIAALCEMFGVFPCSAKVVDVKSDWKDTLRSVIDEMRTGDYGVVGRCFDSRYFDWGYLTADLLDEVDGDVNAAIRNADLVTMVKFVSAAACRSTETMLKKIFMMLKPGSMVLFIDNAGGGFNQLVSKVAEKCNLMYVYGPIKYEHYTNEAFNVSQWDHLSCYATTVTIHMMQKLQTVQTSIQIRNDSGTKNVFPNKRIKSAVYEPSKQLQVLNLNVPQSSARQEPEINCQAGDRVLNRVQAECLIGEVATDVSVFKNTVKSHVRLNSNLPPFSERPNVRLNKKPECNSEVLVWDQSKHKNGIFATVDSNPMEAYNNDPRHRSSTANDNSTSIAQNGLSSRHRHNNINSSIVFNSASKANNGQLIITNTTTRGTDNLTIKKGLPSMKSKDSSIVNVNSASKPNNGQLIMTTTTTRGTDNLTIKNGLPSMKSKDSSIVNVNSASKPNNGQLIMTTTTTRGTDNLTIKNGLPSMKRKNSSTANVNSASKPNNGELIMTTTTRGTDNLTIKDGLPSIKSKDSSIANVNSASTVYNGISKTYKYNNSGIVVNSQPKITNGNPRMNNYGAIVNPPKGKNEIVNSISNGLPIAATMPNRRSLKQLNAEIEVNEEATYPTSCNDLYISHSEKDKENNLKKNGPIASTNSSRQDNRYISISQENSNSNCCSCCVIS